MAAYNNRLTVTKNAKNRRVTLKMERRDSYGSLCDSFQFTMTEYAFNRALLDAQIIAPWNKVSQ